MKNNQLQDFFEENDFNVHLTEERGLQCAEIETWTDGGVNMIIWLEPFCIDSFMDYVKDFNVDENIDLHRQGKDYKAAFTLKESLKDFTKFNNRLKQVTKELTAKQTKL